MLRGSRVHIAVILANVCISYDSITTYAYSIRVFSYFTSLSYKTAIPKDSRRDICVTQDSASCGREATDPACATDSTETMLRSSVYRAGSGVGAPDRLNWFE
jgi:hypothetical protein